MEDLHRIGGLPALLKYLRKYTDLLDGSQMTVTGRTLAENLEDVPELDFGTQDVVRPLDNPIKPTGHITILRGDLAPGSAVAKLTGKEGARFEGVAKCFDSLDGFYPALAAGDIKPGMVLIFRYQGPKGAPGMPEASSLAYLTTVPKSDHLCCSTSPDVRNSYSPLYLTIFRPDAPSFPPPSLEQIGHVVPEARLGGPIALVRDGDKIVIDSETRKIDWDVGEEERERRKKEWEASRMGELNVKRGVLLRYARDVAPANVGAYCD
ncbi:hypothetical protein EW146_g4724 [Bondarzewia mesenterica]|uniref:Dihydroxy-acid dehydratase n=1 Tax=Bondarzewia mesenterica TaxID=1095465 RepID=A0A4S4LVT7_9AGAM|nr:hypothetical protein EW146_g4724 [Bondarzewia mesenterica]